MPPRRRWFRWSVSFRALARVALALLMLGGLRPAMAQVPNCALNGATGPQAIQGCTVAPLGWKAPMLPQQPSPVFPSQGDAEQAMAGYMATQCTQCTRGILAAPLSIPPTTACSGPACNGGYTQNAGTPDQNIEAYVVTWGFGYEGTPPAPTYYSAGNPYYNYVAAVGLCPANQTMFLDYAPDGALVYMCAPTTTQNPSPAAVIPTMTSLDSTDNGVCRTCQGAGVPTGTKQAYAQDYTNVSPDGIELSRYYNSANGTWNFNYNRAVSFVANPGAQTANATLTRPDGSALNFTASTAPAPQGAAPTGPTARASATASYPWVAHNDNGINQTFIATLTDTHGSDGTITGFDYHNLHDEDEHYDASGRLTSITARSGNALSFTYDSSHRLARIDDAFGRYLILSYTTVTASGSNTWDDGQGGTVEDGFTYYPSSGDWVNANVLASVSDGTQTVSYQYTTLTGGNAPMLELSQVTYPDGTTRQYGYDNALGLLQNVTDESGVVFENYTYYQASGHQLASSAHVGAVDKVTYSGVGSNMSVTDAANRSFTFAASGIYQGVTPITYQSAPCTVCGGIDTYLARAVYDAYGNQTSRTDFDGHVTTRAFDTSRGLPTSITEASGTAQVRTTTIAWDPSFRLPDEVVEPIAVAGTAGTRTTEFGYDPHGNLLTRTVTASVGGASSVRTWSFTYNAAGQTLTATGPRTDLIATTTSTYDSSGNLTRLIDPLGHTTTLSAYTPQGLVGQTVDPNGLTTLCTYDARNRLTDVRRGSSSTHWEHWRMVYAPTGLLTSVVRPNGSSIGYVYDPSHRLVEVDDLDEQGTLQGRQVYTLDNASEVTATTVYDAQGTVVGASSATYDVYGRLYQAIGSANQTTTYTYDLQGNLTGVSDPRHASSSATYDALNRLTTTTDALSGVANLTHDVADNLTVAQDVRHASTTTVRDGFDEVSSLVSPDTGTSTLVHDEDGNVTQTVDASGRTTHVTYDALDRPTQVSYSHGGTITETQTFTYDSCTNGVGRLCGFTDGSGTTAYAYDLFGRVTSRTQVTGSGSASRSFTVGYAYDNAGQPVGMTYPSAQGLTRGFLDNRPVALTVGSTALLSGAIYLPLGGDVRGWTWPVDASTVTYLYDNDQQVTSVVDVDTRHYAYDPNGNVTGVTDPNAGTYAQAYTYDPLNRLAVGTVPAVAATYGYDANGNRTSTKQGASTYSFTVDPASNRYTAAGSATIVTDAAGNITNDGTNTYTFDDKGRMASSTNAAGLITTYAYNALGQRVSKTSANGTTFFVYDEDGHLIGTYDASGVPQEELVYLEDRPVADLRSGTAYRVLTDPLQTPRKLLDPSGNAVWSWDGKEAFGASAPTGTLTFNLRFPEQYADVETGLVNNGFRDYAPAWGRYMESDPIGLGGGWNTYGYVGGNPLGFFDKTGEKIQVVGDVKSFNIAITYLRNDPGMNQIINDLENMPATLVVNAVDRDADEAEMQNFQSNINRWRIFRDIPRPDMPEDQYVPLLNRIDWYTRRGLHCEIYVGGGGNGNISPALALGHEMAHADTNLIDRDAGTRSHSIWFNNQEERRVITQHEWPAASYLGEPLRLGHGGVPFYVDYNHKDSSADSPLSRK